MIRRSLALALAVVLTPMAANAADLMQVYEMARNGDPQLSAAESNRLYSKEGQVQARAALLPSLDGSASLNRSRTSLDGVAGSSTTKQRRYAIDGSQTLFNWTQFANLRAQRDISKAADFTLESANDDLIVRSATTYFNVLVAIESLSAAQTNEAAAKKQFDYADKRLEVGLAPITDVHEARAQYDQARANTILARNTLADAYQALTELTGQPVQGLRGLPEDFRPELPANRGDVNQLVADAVGQNPALKAQELQVSAAESSVSAARGGHYPTLSLGGSWGKSATWGDSVGASSSGPDATTNSIGLTLSVPIFAGGANVAGLARSKAEREVAVADYQGAIQAAFRDVSDALARRGTIRDQMAAQAELERAATESYDLAQARYKEGVDPYLAALIAERTLYSARRTHAATRLVQAANLVTLYVSLGGERDDD